MDKKQKIFSTKERYANFQNCIKTLTSAGSGDFRTDLDSYADYCFVYTYENEKMTEAELGTHRDDVNTLMGGHTLIMDPRFLAGEIDEKDASFYVIQGIPGGQKLKETTFSDFYAIKNPNIKKPEMEPRGFFGKLRDKLSWLLGKSEAQKKFDRKCDVFNAKKNDFLNKNFGLDIKFDKDLLNDEYAKNYIIGNSASNAVNKTIECLNREFNVSKNIEHSIACKGLEYISEMLKKAKYKDPQTEDDIKVKEANDKIKRWLVKYGKDLRNGIADSNLSEDFTKHFLGTCYAIGDAVRLSDRIGKSEVLSRYCTAVNAGDVFMESLENPKYYIKVPEQAIADTMPEYREIPEDTDAKARTIGEILDTCVLSDPEITSMQKKGAESLKKYFADASNFETGVGKAVADHILDLWNQNKTKDVKNVCKTICASVGVDLHFDGETPQTISKAVKAAATNAGIEFDNNADVKEGIENVNAETPKNEQISEQKELENPKIPKVNELVIKATNEVLDACVTEKSSVYARKGAEAIKGYLADDPQLKKAEVAQMVKYLGDFKRKMNGSEAPENVKIFCNKICGFIGNSVPMNDGKPDTAGKAVEAVAETYFKNDESAQKFIETEMNKQKGFSIGGPQ